MGGNIEPVATWPGLERDALELSAPQPPGAYRTGSGHFGNAFFSPNSQATGSPCRSLLRLGLARLSCQIERLDNKIDLVGADVTEVGEEVSSLRGEFIAFRSVVEGRFARLEEDMSKVLAALARILNKLDNPGGA